MNANEKVVAAFEILRYKHLNSWVTGLPIYDATFLKWARDVIAMFFSLARAYKASRLDWHLALKGVWDTLSDVFHRSHSIAQTLAAFLRSTGEVVRGSRGLTVKPDTFIFTPAPYSPTLFAQSETVETRNEQRIRAKSRKSVFWSNTANHLQVAWAK